MNMATRRGRSAALSQSDYERLAAFRHLLRRFLVFSQDAAEKSGLTAQQHQALLAIKGFPGRDFVTTGELAERLCIRHHSAVGMVDRLEIKELVVRRIGGIDRRQVLVQLTPAAEGILMGLSLAHKAEIERLSPLLGAALAELSDSP